MFTGLIFAPVKMNSADGDSGASVRRRKGQNRRSAEPLDLPGFFLIRISFLLKPLGSPVMRYGANSHRARSAGRVPNGPNGIVGRATKAGSPIFSQPLRKS